MANEPKWTPGEWTFKVHAPTGDCGFSTTGTGYFIEAFADIRHEGENARAEAKANAHLIASAPDFAKAAEDMCAVLSRFGDWDDGCFYYNGTSAPELQGPFQALADAIAKARGE